MVLQRLTTLGVIISAACFVTACGGGAEDHQHGPDQNGADHPIESGKTATHTDEDGSHNEHAGDHDDQGRSGHDDHDEMRQAGTHLHGEANLAIAVDGNSLVIEFESPVYNLTGFEYAPKTDEDRALVAEVETRLANPSKLFAMNDAAGCKAMELLQPVSLNLGESHDDVHHADHDDDHDDHDASDEAQSDHDDGHSDVLVDYRFTCTSPDALRSIEVRLFEVFPLFEELDAVYLDQTRQRSATLTRTNARLELDQ